jgi:flagellar basal-body rod modification protein FlgD
MSNGFLVPRPGQWTLFKAGSDQGIEAAHFAAFSSVFLPSSQVTMTDAEFPLSYQVEPGATDVKIRIYSQEGSLVRELTGSSVADGELIDVAWDRRDAVGLPTPPGNFRIEIAATDVNGDPIAATSLTTSGVERVNFTARGPELQLSNGETVLSQVVRSVL